MRVVVAASAAAAVAALAYAVSCKRKPKPDEVAAFEYTGKVVCVTSAAQVRVNIACGGLGYHRMSGRERKRYYLRHEGDSQSRNRRIREFPNRCISAPSEAYSKKLDALRREAKVSERAWTESV